MPATLTDYSHNVEVIDFSSTPGTKLIPFASLKPIHIKAIGQSDTSIDINGYVYSGISYTGTTKGFSIFGMTLSRPLGLSGANVSLDFYLDLILPPGAYAIFGRNPLFNNDYSINGFLSIHTLEEASEAPSGFVKINMHVFKISTSATSNSTIVVRFGLKGKAFTAISLSNHIDSASVYKWIRNEAYPHHTMLYSPRIDGINDIQTEAGALAVSDDPSGALIPLTNVNEFPTPGSLLLNIHTGYYQQHYNITWHVG
jgi:hypothetical protein